MIPISALDLEFVLLICLKATAILALAAVIQATVGHRLSAASRHLLWTMSLLALLALPAISLLLPSWTVPAPAGILPSQPVSVAIEFENSSAAFGPVQSRAPLSAASLVATTEAPEAPERAAAGSIPVRESLLLLYLLGALIVLSRLPMEWLVVRRLGRRGRPATDGGWEALLGELRRALGIDQDVRVLRSSDSLGPMTWGTLAPTILVPAAGDGWSEDRRRAVLTHELAHVARRDCLTQTLALLVCALYWFHPGVWWAARRLRIEREIACDDRVLAVGAQPRAYAGHLLEIARDSQQVSIFVAALAMTRPSQLEGRMRAILASSRKRAVPDRANVVASGAVASLLLVLLACVDVGRSQPPALAEGSWEHEHERVFDWSSGRAPVLAEELRLGSAADSFFTNVRYMAVGQDGSLFVADQPPSSNARVRMFDPAGQFVRNVGVGVTVDTGAGIGAGIGVDKPGPGEYGSVVGMRITANGELAIYDVISEQISIFDAEGNYSRSLQVRIGRVWTGNSFHVDTEGNFYVYGVRTHEEEPVQIVGQPVVNSTVPRNNRFFLKLSPHGVIVDTLDIPLSDIRPQPGFVVMTAEGNLLPFQEQFVYDLTPEGNFVSGHTSEYTFDLQTESGEVRQIRREYEPQSLGPEERAQWEARAAFYTQREPRSASAGVVIPEFKPPYRNLDVAEDGRIWVTRHTEATERVSTTPRPADSPPALTWREPPTFDVFSPDGEFLTTIVFPENTRLLFRDGDHAWGTTVGPEGETYVVRYGLQ